MRTRYNALILNIMAIVFVLPLFLLMALLPSTPGVAMAVPNFDDAIS